MVNEISQRAFHSKAKLQSHLNTFEIADNTNKKNVPRSHIMNCQFKHAKLVSNIQTFIKEQ